MNSMIELPTNLENNGFKHNLGWFEPQRDGWFVGWWKQWLLGLNYPYSKYPLFAGYFWESPAFRGKNILL